MKINSEILEFSNFISKSFAYIQALSQKIEVEKHYIILADKIENGYLQFIWEIMVESLVCRKGDYLEPYGDGADFYDRSSRVTFPNTNSNKKILVHAKETINVLTGEYIPDMTFDFIKIVHFDGKAYSQTPPFGFVLSDDHLGNKHLFNINKILLILVDGGD